MTPEEIGNAINWLCQIHADSGVMVTIRCDDCDMTFGAVHTIEAGYIVRAKGFTLVESLQDVLRQRESIESYILENAK